MITDEMVHTSASSDADRVRAHSPQHLNRQFDAQTQTCVEQLSGAVTVSENFAPAGNIVGKVPLRDLVRETTDIIERLCIEAALQINDNNRAGAADMLGLSRQSLWDTPVRHRLHHRLLTGLS